MLFYDYIFDGFCPEPRTTGLDFYVPNTKSIISNGEIASALKALNYEMLSDSLTNKTKFASADGFELEFLTKLNRKGLSCVKLGNTTIYAESLSYVDIFNSNFIEIEYDNLKVKVASPASFVLQKLLINDLRKEYKKAKDISLVKSALLFIKASNKYNNELIQLYKSLPNSWKKKIKATIKNNNIDYSFE